MITVADGIAAYGAALATILAILQFNQWVRTQDRLLVVPSKEFRREGDHLEVTITNISHSPVHLDFVGIGFDYRPWTSPWKRKYEELHSMNAVQDDHLSGLNAGGWVFAGETTDVYWEGRAFAKLKRHTYKAGFRPRLAVWIDHSQSEKSLRKAVRLQR